VADSLTKFMTADFLRSVMQRGSYQLRARVWNFEAETTSSRWKDSTKENHACEKI
jgi:hypothetical protein